MGHRPVETQAQRAAAPDAKCVGWSTAADPLERRRKPTPYDKQRADAAETAKADFARRHPDAAKAERRMRKGRAELLGRWRHKNEGTPETHEQASRRNQGALARLYMSGAIDAEQLAAAVEIATVAERIGADVAVRTASLEARVDGTRSGDGGFHERLGQVRREVAYTKWRRAARGPIAAVLDMIVGETVGYTVVAARYGMHNRTAKRLLIDALDLWPRMLGEACKRVDEDALAAAHARLVG